MEMVWISRRFDLVPRMLDIRRANPADDYELLQRVGSGTYGEVYKARHIRSGDLAAVKVIKLEPGDNFAVIQQEIQMIKECSHPNIISYHNSYLRRDRLWIVMEYCGGGSLQDIYHMTGSLSELQIAFVCRETLKGLDYLHHMGKVHRDIKGANILLSHSGDVKLADFGVAAQITATIGKRKSFIGTPYWMAPEVACVERRGGYGSQCDVWAMGITAIELAECQPPLFEMHPMQVLYMMTKNSFKSPTLKDKHRWSPIFHDFIKLCLTKNPKKRPLPEKLLATHHFVLGSLSSRMTRDLLDKVNNGSAASSHSLQDSSSFTTNESDVASDEEEYEQKPVNMPSRVGLPCVDAVRIGIPRRQSDGRLSPASPPSPSRGFHSERTLPARDMPPLPDVVGGASLLDDGDGCLNDCDTLRAPLAPPRTLRDIRRGNRSASTERHIDVQMRNGFETETLRPKTYFGLPYTPKVSMGACFAKLIEACALRLNAAMSWTHPLTGIQMIILGAEEGIFSLDTSQLHEGQLTKIHDRRCQWLFVYKDVLMAMQGKTSYLYRHDLIALTQKNLTLRISRPMNKVPEKYIPKKLAITVRLPETKGALQCTVAAGEGAHAQSMFLCCCVPSSVLLFQWYGPLNKFLLVRAADLDPSTRFPIKPFSLINRRSDFPQLCIGVRQTDVNDVYRLEFVSFEEPKIQPGADVLPCEDPARDVDDRYHRLDIVGMHQAQRNTLLFAFKNKVVATDCEGREKPKPSVFTFNFHVEALLVLSDSLLAFHSHGVQGRHLESNTVTQDLWDTSKCYRVIGNDKVTIVKSRALSNGDVHDILMLTGHEDTPIE